MRPRGMGAFARALGLISAALLGAAGCDLFSSGGARAGGGGFEGETIALSGQLFYPDGAPAAGARVRLRPREFQPGDAADLVLDTLTGDDGSFRFPEVPEGNYIVESFDAGTKAVQVPVEVETPGPADTLVNLPPDTLRRAGAVRGLVARAPGDTSPLPSGTARVVGLDRSVPLAPDGSWIFADLPPGTVDIQVTLSDPPTTRRMNGVKVVSGGITDADTLAWARPDREMYSAWPHSRTIRLNTSAAGAGVSENVVGFPLLVRLDSTNFDFSRIAHRADGADLRFGKSDGTPLAYEIEWWAPAIKQAAIWVRIDTVYGNRSDQVIVMHWGRPDVFRLSNPKAVFRAGEGFAGVWHLGKVAAEDASGLSTAGSSQGTVVRPGIAGQGRRFDGADYVRIPDSEVLRPAAFTLSCWILREGAQAGNARIVYKGIRRAPFASYTLDLRRPAGGLTFKVAKEDGTDRHAIDPADMPDKAWVHASATYDPATGTGTLYVDGRPVNEFKHVSPVKYFPEDSPMFIGNETAGATPNRPVRGILDEARLARFAYPPHRVKLEYESQRPGSRLLEFP